MVAVARSPRRLVCAPAPWILPIRPGAGAAPAFSGESNAKWRPCAGCGPSPGTLSERDPTRGGVRRQEGQEALALLADRGLVVRGEVAEQRDVEQCLVSG